MFDTGTSNTGLTESTLSGVSRLYGNVTKIRETLYQKKIKKTYRLPCYVISVGNITIGGTGKTPVVVYLAELAVKLGYTATVVSRGYGGTATSEGGIVSDGSELLLNVCMAGDEPFMMAKRLLPVSVPVVVGSNRYEAGMTAVRTFKPDIIILDDGFQHMKLERDLNICLFDAESPLGNGRVIPRGTLREPATAVNRADVIVLTRADDSDRAVKNFHHAFTNIAGEAAVEGLPIFTASHKPCAKDTLSSETDVYAFSGIAKNIAFRNTLLSMGYQIKGFKDYPDHYSYTAEDCSMIEKDAEKTGVRVVMTTEKDFARIENLFDWRLKLIIINVDMDFGNDANLFDSLIRDILIKGKR